MHRPTVHASGAGSGHYKENGYRRWTVGETSSTGSPDWRRSSVADWLASPAHRANLVSRRFRDAGIGVVFVEADRASSAACRRRSSPWMSAPGVTSCARRPQAGPLSDLTQRNRPPAQLPHPGWGGRPFHPPPAASVTPKITPRSAKIGENVRQHRYPLLSIDRCRTVATKPQETAGNGVYPTVTPLLTQRPRAVDRSFERLYKKHVTPSTATRWPFSTTRLTRRTSPRPPS